MRRFLDNQRGNVAVIFGIAVIPLFAAVGMTIDYGRASGVRAYLQNHMDSAALNVAVAGPEHTGEVELNALRSLVQARYGQETVRNLDVSGRWLNATDYEISVSAEVPLALFQVVPGAGDAVGVSLLTIARINEEEKVVEYKKPHMSMLDPEAGDYNRLYLYCYNHDERNDPVTHGRTQMTAIADNGNTKYDFNMPRCKEGETLSHRLHNVRNARTTPSAWDNPDWQNFQYYTDTTLNRRGVERYDLDGWSILETVHCKTLAECKPKDQGGVIPTGKERTPQKANVVCKPGEYMYFGWEDRPPPKANGQAQGGDSWTDRDYDDIRLILECPDEVDWDAEPTKYISLVR